MRSRFEFINKNANGYVPGTVTVVRSLDLIPDALQDFIVSETKQVAVENQVPILVVSLSMDTKEFVKCLVFGESRDGIEHILKARLFIADNKEGATFYDLLKNFERAIENIDDELGLIIIDGIDSIIPQVTNTVILNNDPLVSLVNLAKKTRLPFLVSDYDNNLETGYPRPDAVVEIELLTDLQDNVQAALYKGNKKIVTTDLYESWRIFEKLLKHEKNE